MPPIQRCLRNAERLIAHAIKRAMALLEWLIVAAALFGGLVSLMYVAQRSLMYFPERLQTPPLWPASRKPRR